MQCSDDPSVQPVLKRSVLIFLRRWRHCSDTLLRCTIGLTGVENLVSDRLTCSLDNSTVNAPMPISWVGLHVLCPMHRHVHRFIQWLSVRPVQGHQLNRCYYFCIHLSNSSQWSFGHLKNILSAFSLWFECLDDELNTTIHRIGHIEFYPWDIQIQQMWSHKLINSIDYVITQSLKSQPMT